MHYYCILRALNCARNQSLLRLAGSGGVEAAFTIVALFEDDSRYFQLRSSIHPQLHPPETISILCDAPPPSMCRLILCPRGTSSTAAASASRLEGERVPRSSLKVREPTGKTPSPENCHESDCSTTAVASLPKQPCIR